MKTVKFIKKDTVQFASTLRKNVNDYFKENNISTKGNRRMIIKVSVMLLLYFAPFVVLLTVPLFSWMIFPLAVLMGIGMAGTGMSVMHDAIHGSLSKSGKLNRLLGNTAYLIGANVFTWKIQHNVLHHTYTNIEGYDEDIESKVLFRFSKKTPLKKIHRFQHIYAFFFYSLMTLSKLVRDFFKLHEYNRSGVTREQNGKPRSEYVKMIITKAAYLAIFLGLPLLLTPFSWWMILLGFFIMHFTAGIVMSVIFQMAHLVEGTDHPQPTPEGNIENEWVIHELNTTSNFARNSKLLSWFIGGLNFQVEHHLFPNVCHIHYPKISLIVEKTAHEFGLRYNSQRTFFIAVRSHLRTLKALGR